MTKGLLGECPRKARKGAEAWKEGIGLRVLALCGGQECPRSLGAGWLRGGVRGRRGRERKHGRRGLGFGFWRWVVDKSVHAPLGRVGSGEVSAEGAEGGEEWKEGIGLRVLEPLMGADGIGEMERW